MILGGINNMELNIGDYVRTECGIAKIKTFETKNKEVINLDKEIMICNKDCYRNCCTINQVIKSSPNIIDLIEVEDYVNGMRISEIKSNKNGILKCMVDSDYEFITTIINSEVESVLTKEQFESMEYKIGE